MPQETGYFPDHPGAMQYTKLYRAFSGYAELEDLEAALGKG